MPSKRYRLLKIGKKPHMERLFNEGLVYISPLKSFQCSDSAEREDPYEGFSFVANKEARLRVSKDITAPFEEWEPIETLHIPGDYGDRGIYCMSGLERLYSLPKATDRNALYVNEAGRHYSLFAHPRLHRFGEWGVLIHDCLEFLRRVETAMSNINLDTLTRMVTYVSPKRGMMDLGPFRKDGRLKHQSEVRMMTATPISGPIKLKIGSITDIADLANLTQYWDANHSVCMVNERVEVNEMPAGPVGRRASMMPRHSYPT